MNRRKFFTKIMQAAGALAAGVCAVPVVKAKMPKYFLGLDPAVGGDSRWRIRVVNWGSGYAEMPTVSITSGGGTGVAARTTVFFSNQCTGKTEMCKKVMEQWGVACLSLSRGCFTFVG